MNSGYLSLFTSPYPLYTFAGMKTLIVGLGNPILTDDGVGVKVAYQVDDALIDAQRKHITVTEASVGGLRLMELMVGYDRVIIIDALYRPNGNGHEPGSIFRMGLQDLKDIRPTQHSASAHDTTLDTALDMADRMRLPLPKDILIFAVEVEEIFVFSDDPTPAVAKAIPKVTEMVLEEIR